MGVGLQLQNELKVQLAIIYRVQLAEIGRV